MAASTNLPKGCNFRFFYHVKPFSILHFAIAEWFCHVTCVIYTETLLIRIACLSDTLLLRLLFLTAGNIISQIYYIEYVYCEFINVIIRVITSH